MPNSNHSILRHEIFTHYSQVSPPSRFTKDICDICDTLDVIQVATDDVPDPARRLVGYMIGLKTDSFHLRY